MRLLAGIFIVLLAPLVFASAPAARAHMPAITSAGIDHVGITVPNIADAEKFFADTFGCVRVTHIGPYPTATSLSADRKTPVTARSESVDLVMIRCGHGSNIELFEWKNSKGSRVVPNNEDLGAAHIAFYTDDVFAGAAYLRSKGLNVLGEPLAMTSGDTGGETWVHFLSPWGTEMELVGYPKGKAYEKKSKIKLWSPRSPAD